MILTNCRRCSKTMEGRLGEFCRRCGYEAWALVGCTLAMMAGFFVMSMFAAWFSGASR